MAISGVPLPITNEEIKEAIKKHKGVVSSVCKTLDIGHSVFYVKMGQDPSIKECLDLARSEFDELICDLSENVLSFALSQREDLSSALASAKYVLNNKGKKRGYNPPNGDQIVKITCSELQEKYQNGDIKQPD